MRQDILDAIEDLRQAGLLAVHGTCCEYSEAVSCPAETGAGECKCGHDEHNAQVEKAMAILLNTIDKDPWGQDW